MWLEGCCHLVSVPDLQLNQMQLSHRCVGSFCPLKGPGVLDCIHQPYKHRERRYPHCNGFYCTGILGNLLHWNSSLYQDIGGLNQLLNVLHIAL